MRVLMQYGPKLAAVLLAASVLLQFFCPTGLLAAEIQASPPASHSGCHGSPLPDGRYAPSPQRCCAAAPVAKPSPVNAYAAPAPVMAEPVSSGEMPRVTSFATCFLHRAAALPSAGLPYSSYLGRQPN